MTGWTTGICKVNGINVRYIRTGGGKPPVVLLHGLMLSGACSNFFALNMLILKAILFVYLPIHSKLVN